MRRWIDRKDRGSLCRALAGATGDAATLTVLPFVIGRREALDGRAWPRTARGGRRDSSTCWRSTPRSPPTSGRTWCTTWARCAGSSTTPACTSRCSSRAPAAPPGAGGRYDELMARFGRPMPAVGVSLDLDTIAEVPR